MSESEGDNGGDEAEEADEEPAVELGEGPAVEGAPIARIAARLTWGIEKSAVAAREGDVEVRTPDGPRELSALLDEVEATYFATRREFVDALEDAIGSGPVPTAEE